MASAASSKHQRSLPLLSLRPCMSDETSPCAIRSRYLMSGSAQVQRAVTRRREETLPRLVELKLSGGCLWLLFPHTSLAAWEADLKGEAEG
ncbi:hypothetical protein AVEN_242713-1 [Araneus ventricosus]|uniref:Uncharacterized protein n=1 Tax=Araneus ventricosus TaxID=182803 RepID=A0A4Y2DYW8_ARAVE|nr:hypothetical protein AVEN_242713-1 [Araneus ventricosus]